MVSRDVITITDAAASRVNEIIRNSGSAAKGIRFGIKKGDCAGMEYTVSLVIEPDENDDMVEKNGAKIWIDPSALLYLLGSEVDFEMTKLYSGFKFHNPNQVSACGCGESVELKRADLEKFINDNALHQSSASPPLI